MLDYQNLPQVPGRDIQMFTQPSTVTNLQWSTWVKPRGLSMAFIVLLGGGAGAGGGHSAATGSNAGGGGGGGSSSITRVMIPLEFLPDQLFIQVGQGSPGVTTGTATSPVHSYVAIYPNTTAANVLGVSGTNNPNGGVSGTNLAGGAGGGAGTVAAITAMPLAGLGQFFFFGGQSGATGGAQTGAVGGAIAIPTIGNVTMGGSGGGGRSGADFAGGSVTTIANSFLSQYAPAAAPGTNGANNGAGGSQLWKPFWSFSGMGGGATNTAAGVGGAGGKGSYGSGGGGGGAGVTGGLGGDGGNGIVIISCW